MRCGGTALVVVEPTSMLTHARSGARRAQQAWWRHPRVGLALKTAVAAVLAWLCVQPLGGFVDDYPYYAPLGAVIAMSTSIASSVRSSAQAVGAILVGAGLALVVRSVPLPQPVALGVVIAIGMVLAGLRLLGPMGGLVPIASLFVLVVG